MGWFSWFKSKPKFNPSSVMDLVKYYGADDITSISNWISDNIWYYKDWIKADEWQPADVTMKRRKGDCEDFAVLYSMVFTILGWDHRIYCGYPNRGVGHAICVAEMPNGSYCYTSNDEFESSYKTNWQDVVKDAMPTMQVYRYADVRGNTLESFY